MADYVKYGTCGTCLNYSYEGEYKKGYCSYYRTYYYHDETCNNWEENKNMTGGSGGGSGCFVTTACCKYKGLADDCTELTKVRKLRDEHMKNTWFGSRLVELYYEKAPEIVDELNKRDDKAEIYEAIWKRITEITRLIDSGAFDEAAGKYVVMMLWIEALVIPEGEE